MRWILSLYFLYTLLPLRGQITRIPDFPSIPIHALYYHAQDSLLIGTDQGLYLWRPSLTLLDSFPGEFQTYIGAIINIKGDIVFSQFPNHIRSLTASLPPYIIDFHKGMLVMDMAYDSISDKIWIPSYDAGLFSISLTSDSSQHHLLDSTQLTNINSIALDHLGKLWIGTETGVYYWNREFSHVLSLAPTRGIEPIPTGSRITSIQPHQRDIWFAGIGTLWRLKDGLSWEEIPIPKGIQTGKIEDMVFDRFGHLWIAGRNIATFNPTENIWTQFNELQGLNSQHILSLSIDPYDRLWIGTEGKGLYVTAIPQTTAPSIYSTPLPNSPLDMEGPVSRGLSLPSPPITHSIFLMDISASMKPVLKDSLFYTFLASTVQYNNPSNSYSLVTYSNKSTLLQLTTSVDSFRTKIRTWDEFKFGGRTKLHRGLKKTYQLFYNEERFPNQYILLVTDGSYLKKSKVKKLVKRKASQKLPLQIITFGPIGSKVKQRLTELAQIGEGQFYQIEDEEDIARWISFLNKISSLE